MAIDRRSILGMSAGGAAGSLLVTPGRASPMPLGSLGIDVTHFGVNPGGNEDQTEALQRAIDASAEARVPLWLPAGHYRAGDIALPSGAQLFGIRGATRLVLAHGASILAGVRADQITLHGLVFDGRGQYLPPERGLITLRDTRGLRIYDCYLQESGGAGIALSGVEGEIAHTTVIGAADGGIVATDSRGLILSHNTIFNTGSRGIAIDRTMPGEDGSLVLANRIERIGVRAGDGGDGVFVRNAQNAVVAENQIRHCSGAAIRATEAVNLQVRGNSIAAIGDTAILADGRLEGAVVAGNSIDDAAAGISVAGSGGGRLLVVQGNLVRNLQRGQPARGRGVGIAVSSDAAISGNVVEGAPLAGILAGFDRNLRDVTVTGNVVRTSPIGIGLSAVDGSASALVAHNLVAGANLGAVVGLQDGAPVTGDLALDETPRYAQITVSGNRVR